MTGTEELDQLKKRAEDGDRDAIRELRLRKTVEAAQTRLFGDGAPDHNGRVAGDPLYSGPTGNGGGDS